MDFKSNLYPCAHCNCTGTCSNASGGSSCMVCVKENRLKGSAHVGLPCGICGGLGHAEVMTDRMQNRVIPVMQVYLGIGTIIVLLAGIGLSAAFKSPYFNEILAFASPLIGVVLAFFFSVSRGY